MRRQFKIHYPIMYSPETTGDGQLFNCYQRAHQNTLENYPTFLMLLFTGGLQYPIPSALAGTLWIASRVAYSKGYYTGGIALYIIFALTQYIDLLEILIDPKKRMQGSFGYFGLIALLGASTMFGAKLLGCTWN